jgi:hypothetical protein
MDPLDKAIYDSLFTPSNPGRPGDDYEAMYGDYQLAGDDAGTGIPDSLEEQAALREQLLKQLNDRYSRSGPGARFSPQVLADRTGAAYRRELERRGFDPDEYLNPEGVRIKYPELMFDNAGQMEAAKAAYRRQGVPGLIELDPEGYGAYEGFEPNSDFLASGRNTDAYAEHLLPPGYADLLRAERDYDIARMMAEDPELEKLGMGPLRAYTQDNIPFSRHSNLAGEPYYPRFQGTLGGMLNAMESGSNAPVMSGMEQTMGLIPNAMYFNADAPIRTGGPVATPAGVIYPSSPQQDSDFGSSFDKASKFLGERADVRSGMADKTALDNPYGTSTSDNIRSLRNEEERLRDRTPAMGTDSIRSLTGFSVPPVVGDVYDGAVNVMDGSQALGLIGGGPLGPALSAAAKGLKTDAALDLGISSYLGAAYGGNPNRSWGEYLFKPDAERQAAPQAVVDQRSREPVFGTGERKFGTMREAKEFAKYATPPELAEQYKNSRSERAAQMLQKQRERRTAEAARQREIMGNPFKFQP